MYYKEFLRARRCVFVYTLIWGTIFTAAGLLTVWLPMIDVDQKLHAAARAARVVSEPWPALFGVAAILAAIVATVLGSTLSQENDGHLELTLTKPYSRVAYASAVIAVDMAAILVSALIGFAFILLHYVIFHRPGSWCCDPYRLVEGPDPFFNAIRFALFPLAWYAVIAGLSAGLRGTAGIVQSTIWPVTLGLAALQFLPARGVFRAWHDAFVALNVFNPVIYASYRDQVSDTTVQIIGASPVPAAVAAGALLAFIFVGWAAATLQWRRVEA